MHFFRHLKTISFYSLLLLLISSCAANQNSNGNPEIDVSEIKAHISFLADDALEGREAGTEGEAIAANYISDLFRDYGLEPAGDDNTYLQQFTINTAMLKNPHATDATDGEKRLAQNIVGTLQGTGNEDEFIVIGAHYDHLGYGDGGFGSLYRGDSLLIHNGADDNASGTAGLLELAQYFSEYRPSKDILFIAFSGEEMGLLGSEHYVNNPTVDLTNALAMINMDMIGRMENNKLMIFGIGTADDWTDILNTANSDSLTLSLVTDGTGASDHTSFYYKDIPVLHYFTDTHSDYHRPSDDIELINFEGEALVLNHITRVVKSLDGLNRDQLAFKEAPGQQSRSMSFDGPSLGVLPDYGYEGKGMKITGVTKDKAAANAGVKGGDVIIKIAGENLNDIYDYMGMLNKLKKGQLTTITVLRDGKELTFDMQL